MEIKKKSGLGAALPFFFFIFAAVFIGPPLLLGAVLRGPARTVFTRSFRHRGEIYIPLSAVVEAWGLHTYECEDGRCVFRSRDCCLLLTLSRSEVMINDERVVLDAPVERIDGQLIVPIYLAIQHLANRFPPPAETAPSVIKLGRRIVLDPGHGGRDTGAIGEGGVMEKEVALSIARQVKSLLEIRGHEVILIRDQDVFVSLPSRVMIANRAGADLFVSIHANAAANLLARGPETFYYSSPSDKIAAALARLENIFADAEGDNAKEEVREPDPENLLERIKFSRRLAGEIQTRLAGLTPEIDRGVRTAEFFVLKLTRMPAVLVETGFLTNHDEKNLLVDMLYQEKLAEALAAGVSGFFASQGYPATPAVSRSDEIDTREE